MRKKASDDGEPNQRRLLPFQSPSSPSRLHSMNGKVYQHAQSMYRAQQPWNLSHQRPRIHQTVSNLSAFRTQGKATYVLVEVIRRQRRHTANRGIFSRARTCWLEARCSQRPAGLGGTKRMALRRGCSGTYPRVESRTRGWLQESTLVRMRVCCVWKEGKQHSPQPCAHKTNVVSHLTTTLPTPRDASFHPNLAKSPPSVPGSGLSPAAHPSVAPGCLISKTKLQLLWALGPAGRLGPS